MNRNVESHFAELPSIDIQRSIFDRSASHKTSFNAGLLIPFYVDEVLPGDTFKVTTSCVVRLQTPLTPIMDNIYMDTYYFFVPNRLVWTHWKEFMGENSSSPWVPSTTYSVPVTDFPTNGWNVGTIADYMGIPVGKEPLINPISLPFRAYAMICNEWFRDQNLSDPVNINFGDSTTSGSNGSNQITDIEKGGQPFKVAKYHDYFTSLLPAPLKANVPVGLVNNLSIGMTPGSSSKGFAPVITGLTSSVTVGSGTTPLKMSAITSPFTSKKLSVNLSDSDPRAVSWTDNGVSYLVPDNLWADISKSGITINDLRLAFQLQKFLERSALAGTRYREVIKAHFGIVTSDARMMIPEYLGGHRFPLSIHQVTNQTSGSTEFLGDLGAMSNTSDVHEDFIKSFEEHGFVIGVCCVRYDHSYPQGLERFWRRTEKLDYYFPLFSSIGETPVYKYQIMLDDANNVDYAAVFGYSEPWAEYRFKPSRTSSEMRPGVANSLATWHLADYYTTQPSLSDGWIREDPNNIDRVLSVQSSTSNQVFADFYVKNICTRPMPVYSIPGLVDHH